jgi:protein required for attachment to host cells
MRTKAWFIVADSGRGRLLHASRVDHGRLHVDEIDVIENTVGEHEHGRPSPRSLRGGPSYASPGHEQEQQQHRFAKQVSAWIERQVAEQGIAHLTLFSAPRFLGALRKVLPAALAPRIREEPIDLIQVSTSALARHPAVAGLVDESRPGAG